VWLGWGFLLFVVFAIGLAVAVACTNAGVELPVVIDMAWMITGVSLFCCVGCFTKVYLRKGKDLLGVEKFERG
jgi:hypothetical protein